MINQGFVEEAQFGYLTQTNKLLYSNSLRRRPKPVDIVHCGGTAAHPAGCANRVLGGSYNEITMLLKCGRLWTKSAIENRQSAMRFASNGSCFDSGSLLWFWSFLSDNLLRTMFTFVITKCHVRNCHQAFYAANGVIPVKRIFGYL